ncbi:hypothetical protein M878_26565 [Streptomyces roseochromogenus subsp. oscitans DS 12.976]|uniref:Uncharacterized protein n=1 Tax=Streptomyces roseochromogenus subsp. oscitans DS 12.976 TaxID=1352936 RepID=V6KCG6_STRRC|nr:hypothetical protein M878_26565 [Streptomyces roseochromogenus subsp. oscitans DS 12.976]
MGQKSESAEKEERDERARAKSGTDSRTTRTEA